MGKRCLYLEVGEKSQTQKSRNCYLNGFRREEEEVYGFHANIIICKAKALQEGRPVDIDRGSLVYSDGWVQKFMARNGLSLRRRTTEAQKNPNQLVNKICAYILKVRRLRKRMDYGLNSIIAMDETAISNDMNSNTTVEKRGAHTVHLKTTGHEKSRVTVCLTATAS